jgi:hypothetical protein
MSHVVIALVLAAIAYYVYKRMRGGSAGPAGA